MIRVLLVDDSPIALHILQRLLRRAPDIEVVGTAANGREALERIAALAPDVVCTDLHMPVMDGLALTRALMARQPLPILVVSVSAEPHSPNVFRLLEAGAVDVYPKPRDILEADQEKMARELASKLRIVAGVHVFRRNAQARGPAASPPPALPEALAARAPVRIVVLGASTGGPNALRTILAGLPSTFPVPLACVQHIGADFLPEMVRWLGEACALPVRLAAHDEVPRAGVAYFAPGETHLEFDAQGRFSLTAAPPCSGHRPSATVAMRAAAQRFGAGTLGVLLTGMGDDGAAGLATIAAAGGVTIAQDEASCVVYGMPRQAVELGAVRHVLPLEQIAPALVALTRARAAATGTEEMT